MELFIMKKLALIFLLGFGFALSQAIAEDIEEEIEYVEEYEEGIDDGANEVDEIDGGEEYVDEGGDSNVEESANATARANQQAPLEPLDEGDEFADEIFESGDENEEYADETSDDTDDTLDYNAISGDGDGSDITRWNYSEQEIARKEEIRRRQAEREAEYAKSLQRRRSGLFFGLGMGFSDTTLKDLAGVIGGSILSMQGEINVTGIGVGGFVGYQQAFNEYSGIRAYGEFDYNLGNGIIVAQVGGETVKADNNLWKALGNIDFYLEGNMGRNQTETLGFFFGLGAGYIFYKGGKGKDNAGGNVTWKSLHMVGLVVNYGIHTILGTNHRLELFVRNYPFIRVQEGQNYTTDSFKSNIDAWIRYSYMF